MSDLKQRVELLPCPFCCNGAVVEIQHVPDTRIYGRKSPWAAHCIGCGATGLKSTDKNEAIMRWNQRANLAEREAKLVEALKDVDELWGGDESFKEEQESCKDIYLQSPLLKVWTKVRATIKSLGIEGEG